MASSNEPISQEHSIPTIEPTTLQLKKMIKDSFSYVEAHR